MEKDNNNGSEDLSIKKGVEIVMCSCLYADSS
jgi:hypothetical protein